MVLDKLSVSGRLNDLDNSRTMAYCVCSRFGWDCLGIMSPVWLFRSSFSLSLEDGQIKTEILPQRAVKPITSKQPTKALLFTLDVKIIV